VTSAQSAAEDWCALGRQLSECRRAAGLSQVQLAPLAGYSRSTVANVETGRQHVPRDFWTGCDTALRTGDTFARAYDEIETAQRRDRLPAVIAARNTGTPAVTGDRAVARQPTDPSPDGTPGLDQVESLRQRLNSAIGEGAVIGASLDAWEQTVLSHGQATRYRPAGELVLELGADLAELERAIAQCRSASSLRRLVRVAAHLSGLMCLMFVKLDQRPEFRRWARTARTAAGEAGDPATFSWVLAQEAYGHYYSGDLGQAVSTARHAQAVVRTAPCGGAALAAALEARAHAVLGDARQTRRALERAEAILAALDTDTAGGSAFGYTESQLRFHEGNAYTHLRDTRSALKAQDRALELCPPGDYTDWALIRLDRAACLARDGDVSAAIAYGTETLSSLTSGQSQGIIVLRGRELAHALPLKYRTDPAVREFQELLMSSAETIKELPRQ
jgi:tetratricopeptide (TPR) repeat protein